MQTTFIKKQMELHRKAADTLQSIQIQLEVLSEMDPSKTHYQFMIQRKLDAFYITYHDTVKELMEGIVPDMNIQGVIVHKENCATLAEAFHY